MSKYTNPPDDRLRDATTCALLAEAQSLRWDMADLETDPNPDDEIQRGSLSYLAARHDRVLTEVARRERLRAAPSAPPWPGTPPDRSAELRELKDRLPIAGIVYAYSPREFIERGDRLWMCCPFLDHDDETPSFVIDRERNLFYCHGCHRGGDVFTFVQLMLDLDTFGAAADVLRAIAVGPRPKLGIVGKDGA